MICQVCFVADHKYKCPNCFLKYCSVVCYGMHGECKATKETKHLEATRQKEEDELNKPDVTSKSEDLSDEEDRVLIDNLQRLRSDPRLMDCLRNPHLRNIISRLDVSYDPAKDVLSAMMEPIFVEFVDNCLRIVP